MHPSYTLYTPYAHALYTLFIHSMYTINIHCIYTIHGYVLSMHSSHALARFYRHHLYVQLNVDMDIDTHLHIQMHSHIQQIHIQHIDTQILSFPPSTQHTHATGGEVELIFQHAYYILSSLTTSCSPFHTMYPHHRGGRGVP